MRKQSTAYMLRLVGKWLDQLQLRNGPQIKPLPSYRKHSASRRDGDYAFIRERIHRNWNCSEVVGIPDAILKPATKPIPGHQGLAVRGEADRSKRCRSGETCQFWLSFSWYRAPNTDRLILAARGQRRAVR